MVYRELDVPVLDDTKISRNDDKGNRGLGSVASLLCLGAQLLDCLRRSEKWGVCVISPCSCLEVSFKLGFAEGVVCYLITSGHNNVTDQRSQLQP